MKQSRRTEILIGMKRQPEQTRGAERVTAILDACENLLDEKSFDQIRIDEVLERAKVSKGTLYYFFEDKQSVFLSVMHRALADVGSVFSPKPGEEKLEFVKYIFEIERRLDRVWKRHRGMLEYYLSNRFHPELRRVEQFSGRIMAKVIAGQLIARHPDINPARAESIGLTLGFSIYAVLDRAYLLPPKDAAPLRREWRQMMAAYIRDVVARK